MAKTRKKELAFFFKDLETQTEFLELIRKKVTMVDVHITAKHDKIRVIISGTHDGVRYASELIKRIRDSLSS